MTNIKAQVQQVVNSNKDSTQAMVCFWTPSSYHSFFNNNEEPIMVEIRCTFDELPDYEYDDGYGLQEGPTVRCYTEDYIYFTHEYDGAEWIISLPRNPTTEEVINGN